MGNQKGFITLLEITLGTVFVVLGLTSSIFLLQLLRMYNRGLINESLGASLAQLRMEELRSLANTPSEKPPTDPKSTQVPISQYSIIHPESQVGDQSSDFRDFFMNTQIATLGGNSNERVLTVWVFYPGLLGGQSSYALSTLYSQR